MEGTFLWSLVATDVCSGWTDAVALVAREQSLVVEGLEVIRRQLPVPILGIDSDNDSAFINETLQVYCKERRIEFTRSRPYKKNDQAWIEQKNGSVIRRFVGYRRFSGLIAGQCLARIYRLIRLYVNFFQPSFKLLSKTRDGAKIKKKYHKPATPCERLMAHASVSDAAKEALRAELAPLDPAELLHQIREGQAALAALSSGDLSHGPDRQSLEEFLAKLPELWREGEVRPTHRQRSSSPRTWRTRKDPFEEVWPEILVWLQHDPDSTAKSLMERLQHDYPGRFPDVQLRTLQRRIREWRHVMAKSLVHGIRDGNGADEEPIGRRGECGFDDEGCHQDRKVGNKRTQSVGSLSGARQGRQQGTNQARVQWWFCPVKRHRRSCSRRRRGDRYGFDREPLDGLGSTRNSRNGVHWYLCSVSTALEDAHVVGTQDWGSWTGRLDEPQPGGNECQ